MRPLRPASPRAHLKGTLALVRALAALAQDEGRLPPLLAFLDRPEALPASVAPELNTLKYDAYMSRGPQGPAWGVAVGDRYEGSAMLGPLRALLQALGGAYALDDALSLKEQLAGARPALTVSFGYDSPGEPPRVKIYLQEDRWGEGVARAAELSALLQRRPGGCALPAWVPAEARIGVLTVELLHSGDCRYKVYLGASRATDLPKQAPEELRTLALTLERLCGAVPGYTYSTLRLRPGEAPRLAINKIYDHMSLGFAGDPKALAAAWAEVEALFAHAGREELLRSLRSRLGELGLLVLPTATALEAQGRSVDLYCGAWWIEEGGLGEL